MLILAPRHEVIELDMTIEEGMKVIVSGGLFSPSGETKIVLPELPDQDHSDQPGPS